MFRFTRETHSPHAHENGHCVLCSTIAGASTDASVCLPGRCVDVSCVNRLLQNVACIWYSRMLAWDCMLVARSPQPANCRYALVTGWLAGKVHFTFLFFYS